MFLLQIIFSYDKSSINHSYKGNLILHHCNPPFITAEKITCMKI